MIIGCGIDSIEINRIANVLSRFPDRFLNRLFTPFERQGEKTPAYYAKRFAAKEATLKAMGIGLRQGLNWHDLEITSSPLGQPQITITNKAHKAIQELHKISSGNLVFHISLSDTKEYAQAIVILEHT